MIAKREPFLGSKWVGLAECADPLEIVIWTKTSGKFWARPPGGGGFNRFAHSAGPGLKHSKGTTTLKRNSAGTESSLSQKINKTTKNYRFWTIFGLLDVSGVPLGGLRGCLGGLLEASLEVLGASWSLWRPRSPQAFTRTPPNPPKDLPKGTKTGPVHLILMSREVPKWPKIDKNKIL